MGSNMAEQHPVGFQWVMEAKERGAKVIHVDPRFTRTSAMADLHVPIRPGTDIAFLGGIVNYIFRHEAYFEEYVRHYTNGPVILKDEFIDTDEVSGFFSGLGPRCRARTRSTAGATTRRAVRPRRARRSSSPTCQATRPTAHMACNSIVASRRTSTTRCRMSAAFSRCCAATSLGTRPRTSPTSAGAPRPTSSAWRRPCARTRAASGRRRSSTRSAGRTTPSVCRTSGRARSSSCCSATSGARAAACWHCAGTRTSRAPPTSRRSTTSCPATSRCRIRRSTRRSTRSSNSTGRTRGRGATCARTSCRC